jgi:hypothetical protein
MTGLGLIETKRLAKMPGRFHARHEFCFHLHDSMLSLFHDLAQQRFPTIQIDFENSEEFERFQSAPDPISYFLETDREVAKRLSVGQAMMATFSDFFNFVYEGLIALEKRKFVVAYALLRKPLKENLLLLTMMLVDDEEFFARLEKSPAANFGHPGVQDTHRKDYFRRAKEMVPYSDFLDAGFLHDLIFDVSLAAGLAPLFDTATHLVTNRAAIRTKDLNLNFVFKDPADNDVYETIYNALGYILLYALLLEIELFKKADLDGAHVSKWFAMTGLGAYHALFLKGQSPLVTSLNRTFGDLLTCPHCDAKLRITKRGAARFFVVHKLLCKSCGREHDFPLFWLMSKAEWQIFDDGAPGEEEDQAPKQERSRPAKR